MLSLRFRAWAAYHYLINCDEVPITRGHGGHRGQEKSSLIAVSGNKGQHAEVLDRSWVVGNNTIRANTSQHMEFFHSLTFPDFMGFLLGRGGGGVWPNSVCAIRESTTTYGKY